MTQLPSHMDAIHRLLNYAYAEFSTPDYVSLFMAQRAADLARVQSHRAIPGFNAVELDIDTLFESVCVWSDSFHQNRSS